MTRPLQLLLALATCACAADLPLAILDISPDSGRSPSDGITASPTLTINGQGRVGDEIAIAIDSKAAGIVRVAESGNWTYAITGTPLAHGQHVLSASSGLGAGQHASSYTILVDTKAPAAPTFTVAEPDTGSSATDWVTSAHDLVLRGKGEAGSQVSLSIASIAVGTATVAASGDWSLPLAGFAEGAYSLSAQAIDAAGNASPAALKTLRVDSTPPAAPSIASMSTDTGPSATDRITRDVTPTVGGLAESGATVAVFVDGVAAGTVKAGSTGAWSLTTAALADGERLFTAIATDGAGLASAASAAFPVLIKTTAQAPGIGFAPDSGQQGDRVTNAKALVFSGSAGDGVLINVTLDGTLIGNPAVVAGAWSLDWTGHPIETGTHAVVATATDLAGNKTAAVLNLTIDNSPPSPPTGLSVSPDPANPSAPIYAGQPVATTGWAEPGQLVQVSVDGVALPAIEVGAAGHWMIMPVTFTAGDHTVSALAIDAAGNIGSPGPAIVVHATEVVLGERVTVHFTATVTLVDDPSTSLFGFIQPGTAISGSYTYRQGALDSSAGGNIGTYTFSEPGLGITVDAWPFAFASDPTKPSFLMQMVNNYYNVDNYLLRSYRNVGTLTGAVGIMPVPVEHIGWQLDDSSMRALSSDALTGTPPYLAHWQNTSGLEIVGGRSPDPMHPMPWVIRAHVTQVWLDGQQPGDPVPEPPLEPAPSPEPSPEPIPAPAPGNG